MNDDRYLDNVGFMELRYLRGPSLGTRTRTTRKLVPHMLRRNDGSNRTRAVEGRAFRVAEFCNNSQENPVMAVVLVQEVFSHASCKKALALAAEALIRKLGDGHDS